MEEIKESEGTDEAVEGVDRGIGDKVVLTTGVGLGLGGGVEVSGTASCVILPSTSILLRSSDFGVLGLAAASAAAFASARRTCSSSEPPLLAITRTA